MCCNCKCTQVVVQAPPAAAVVKMEDAWHPNASHTDVVKRNQPVLGGYGGHSTREAALESILTRNRLTLNQLEQNLRNEERNKVVQLENINYNYENNMLTYKRQIDALNNTNEQIARKLK